MAHQEHEESRKLQYPLDSNSYKILNELGRGLSAIVCKAVCVPMNYSVVAIKTVDLDRSRANFESVRREAKTMSLLSHPNILKALCYFMVDRCLWVVMPFMCAGSLQSIIASSFPNGLSIKLADFGVSASIYEMNSTLMFTDFTDTPYWMAPKVVHSHNGGLDFLVKNLLLDLPSVEQRYNETKILGLGMTSKREESEEDEGASFINNRGDGDDEFAKQVRFEGEMIIVEKGGDSDVSNLSSPRQVVDFQGNESSENEGVSGGGKAKRRRGKREEVVRMIGILSGEDRVEVGREEQLIIAIEKLRKDLEDVKKKNHDMEMEVEFLKLQLSSSATAFD
ncbi:hypothetical protein LguiA_002487 [Lonicera macranthoides]